MYLATATASDAGVEDLSRPLLSDLEIQHVTDPVLHSLSSTHSCPEGLQYRRNFLSPAAEEGWLAWINNISSELWIPDFRRRKLCFGYLYDYARRTVAEYLGPLPPFVLQLAHDVVGAGLMGAAADQVIINEYLPSQGISAHTDASCFGPEIVSISLGSGSVMRLRERRSGVEFDIYLERCSALLIGGAARTDWTHELIARKRDRVNGVLIPRSLRLSITLRTVIRPVQEG